MSWLRTTNYSTSLQVLQSYKKQPKEDALLCNNITGVNLDITLLLYCERFSPYHCTKSSLGVRANDLSRSGMSPGATSVVQLTLTFPIPPRSHNRPFHACVCHGVQDEANLEAELDFH